MAQQVKSFPRTIRLPDGQLRMIRVYSLDGIEAIPTWVLNQEESTNRLQIIIPIDYPKTKLGASIDRIRKYIKRLPINPRRANMRIAIHARNSELVKAGKISRTEYKKRISDPGYHDSPLTTPDRLKQERKSRLVSVKAKKPRNRRPIVSKSVWSAIRNKWIALRHTAFAIVERLPILEHWYESNYAELRGPLMKGKRLLRYAQSASFLR